ncbi:MAG: FAD-dependent oxidoreductase [Bacillota bacterium]
MAPESITFDAPYIVGYDPSTANKTGEWSILTPRRGNRVSPCSLDCLLDGEVPSWLEAMKLEKWEEAWQIMKRANPFPAITGYVCFHPCTENCNRGQLDEPIAIPEVEKAIGLWRLENYQQRPRYVSGKGKIAVVGSGPAGLSCAFYLTEAGYDVTVFECDKQPGGMLNLCIPEYRLPRKILQKEIDVLQEEGITFVCDCRVGSDIKLQELYKDYERVFLATGSWLSRRLSIKGEDQPGVWTALDFLSTVNRGDKPDLEEPVFIIGGGNAAVDSARMALRLDGVKQVSLFYRRSRLEMPAEQVEVEAAVKEGVELNFNEVPCEIKSEQGKIKTVVFAYSRTNRQGLHIDQTRIFHRQCGTVIMALGQKADYSMFENMKDYQRFFAGGDLVSGPSTVAEAIKAGRIAALSITADLEGLTGPTMHKVETAAVAFEELNLAVGTYFQPLGKQLSPIDEADRCLGCGTCTSCGICYLFCPDLAVRIVDGRCEFDLDYCKGCGICEKECPSRALVMEGGR